MGTEAKFLGAGALEELTCTVSLTSSDAITTNGNMVCSLSIPATFTSTALTFQGSFDGVTYQAINKDGAALSYTVAQGKEIVVNPTDFMGFNFLKLIPGTSEASPRSVKVRVRW